MEKYFALLAYEFILNWLILQVIQKVKLGYFPQ